MKSSVRRYLETGGSVVFVIALVGCFIIVYSLFFGKITTSARLFFAGTIIEARVSKIENTHISLPLEYSSVDVPAYELSVDSRNRVDVFVTTEKYSIDDIVYFLEDKKTKQTTFMGKSKSMMARLRATFNMFLLLLPITFIAAGMGKHFFDMKSLFQKNYTPFKRANNSLSGLVIKSEVISYLALLTLLSFTWLSACWFAITLIISAPSGNLIVSGLQVFLLIGVTFVPVAKIAAQSSTIENTIFSHITKILKNLFFLLVVISAIYRVTEHISRGSMWDHKTAWSGLLDLLLTILGF